MSDRMSVSLNWDHLCIVCEEGGEVPSAEEVLLHLQQETDERFARIYFKQLQNLLFFFFFFTYFTKSLQL